MSIRCEHCEELEEQVRQLRALIAPEVWFPTAWNLTPQEVRVLRAFLKRSRISRDVILNAMYEFKTVDDPRVVDVYIGRVRAKLKQHETGIIIEAEHGYGYRISNEHQQLLLSMTETV